MSRTATQKGRLPLVIGSAAVAAAAGAAAFGADLMVGYGFGKALQAQKPVLPFELAGNRRPAGEVGDEVYWLSRSELHSQPTSDRRLAVGDRVSVTGHDGRVLHLEVVNLRVVGTPLFKIAAGAAPVPLLLVTCRVVDATGTRRRNLVHFMMEAEEPKPTALPADQGPLGRT